MTCNFDCLATYNCFGSPEKPQPRSANLTPFVRLGFGGESREITTGNNSSLPDNRAVIKSMDYGFSDGGVGITLEIIDQDGSDFKNFVKRLSKTLAYNKDRDLMFVEFGWIRQDCYGLITVNTTNNHGGTLSFLPKAAETTHEGSIVKIKLTGTDLFDRIAEQRIERNLGTEDNKITLKDAIRKLFRENEPHIDKIEFRKAIGGNTDCGEEWGFKVDDGGCDGPKAVWSTEQQNALAVCRRWLSPFTTRDGKGVVIQWNPTDFNLVLLEDPTPAKDEKFDCCTNNLGTFIVNGGDCSNVISFTPTINWTLAYNSASGGGGAAGATATTVKSQDNKEDKEKSGVQTTIVADNNATMYRPADQIPVKIATAERAHSKACRIHELPSSINAELKIQGDPSFAFPIGNSGVIGKNITIIVISPFYITKTDSGCDWLAQPVCHPVLSNKNWTIIGMNHQIADGSYTTTLKVVLATPNNDLDRTKVLGGDGCGTESYDIPASEKE